MKKIFLFSLALLLFVCVSVSAQQATTAAAVTPAAVQETYGVAAVAASGDSYLGITGTEVTRENMGRYNMREPRGVAITRVADGSPAARAGLKTGDVILRFDGEEVSTYRKLQRLINESAPEQNVRLGISRNGAEQEINVTLDRRENSMQALSRVYGARPRVEGATPGQFGTWTFGWGRRIGISTTQLTRQLADYFGIQGGRGLLVTSVSENSPAARAGIKAGDVITEVDGEKVESSGDLTRVINRKNEGSVNLRVVRDRQALTLTVTPEKREQGTTIISPELFEFETDALEITVPSVDIRVPEIKMAPIKLPRIAIPKVKISPKQMEMLRRLEDLKMETLKLEDLMWL